jgi:predicted MFS family arabinose efflux permease
VEALQFLPMLLFSLFAGVLADRFPKRRLLLFTRSGALLQAVILWLLVATSTIQWWHLLILASWWGSMNAMDVPARQSFVVELVGRSDVPNAISLNSSQFSMARMVGHGLGGLIIAWLGVTPLFLMNALSFVPVLMTLALMDESMFHAVVAPRETGRINTSRACGRP